MLMTDKVSSNNWLIYKHLVNGIFANEEMIKKIQNKLPYMFQIAQIESSRAGKTGMEVGYIRERIIVALLIYKFGGANVETEILLQNLK